MTKKLLLLLTGCLALTSLGFAQTTKMYISDAGNFDNPPWKILRFDADGQNGEIFIDHHLAWPQDIVFLEEQNVMLVSNLNTGEIVRFDATTGEYINSFATGIGGPTRIKFGEDGLLYVLQWVGNGKVWRYTRTGEFVDEFTDTGVVSAIGLDWDADGNLYVSSYSGFVQKFSPTGEDLGVFINHDLAGPTNIWFDESCDLLVSDYNAANVKRFSSDGTYEGIFISPAGQVEGVDFLANGDILLGIGAASAVRQYSSTGTFIKAVVPAGTLGLLTPNAVVLRTTNSTSLPDDLGYFKETAIVTPTVGVSFHFVENNQIQDSSLIEIFNINGRMVHSLRFNNNSSWEANLTDGTYYITASLKDGLKARQTVIIQH